MARPFKTVFYLQIKHRNHVLATITVNLLDESMMLIKINLQYVKLTKESTHAPCHTSALVTIIVM